MTGTDRSWAAWRLRTLGYGPGEILALGPVTDIIPEDQRDQVREMIRRREAGDDREVRYTTKVRCHDGTVIDAEIHGSITIVEGERFVVGVAVDVTNQTASHGHLREREEYFRALTDHARDLVAIASSDHVLTYVSPSVTRVLGYEPGFQRVYAVTSEPGNLCLLSYDAEQSCLDSGCIQPGRNDTGDRQRRPHGTTLGCGYRK